MWEAIWLSAISAQVPILHEVSLEDGRKPDLELTVENDAASINIIGDIIAASDAGLPAATAE
jgi:hypothetical protein